MDSHACIHSQPRTTPTSQAFHAHAPQPLPPHALTPHDVVALRPGTKGPPPPPLAQGVVYRVRDDAIVVALDDTPEEELEGLLRIDKLGNEVVAGAACMHACASDGWHTTSALRTTTTR